MSEETTDALMKPQPGEVTRTGFGTTELAQSAETASSAVAAAAQAAIQARYIVALQRPRDLDQVRQDVLDECARPGAGKAFWYRKPVGKGVEGLTIRFAEVALRCMRNVMAETQITWDDPQKRVVLVTVTDLEANLSYPQSILIEKTVERSQVPAGDLALRTRTNSRGEPVYTLRATEDETFAKQNALVSKAIRNGALRLLPGDIREEAKQKIREARRGAAIKDPAAERKKIADAFREIGVSVSELKRWLGHSLDTASPAEITDLRDGYQAIKAGETTWHDLVEERGAEPEGASPVGEPQPAIDALTANLKEAGGGGGAQPSPSAEDPYETGKRQAREQKKKGQQKLGETG